MGRPKTNFLCIAPDCSRNATSKGLCFLHAYRMKHFGQLDLPDRPPFADKIWANVDSSGGQDACWPWVGRRNPRGYGSVWKRGTGEYRAHRAAWEIVNGPIPNGGNILHRCDNPPCCNPRHLWVGTQADNMGDCAIKGRTNGPKGKEHWNAKLTEEDVCAIRTEKAAGATYKALASKWGVSLRTIGYVVKGGSWKHVSSHLP